MNNEDDEEVLPLIRIKESVVATKVLKPKLTKIVQTDNNKERVGSDPDSRRSETRVKKPRLTKIALTISTMSLKEIMKENNPMSSDEETIISTDSGVIADKLTWAAETNAIKIMGAKKNLRVCSFKKVGKYAA